MVSSSEVGLEMSGLVRSCVPRGAILIEAPQVLPPFLEASAAQKYCCGEGCVPDPRKSIAPMLTSVPSGRTAIWLPVIQTTDLIIGIGVDHVSPPSSVLENIGMPE